MSAPQQPQHRWYHNKTEAGAEHCDYVMALSIHVSSWVQILIAVLASLMTGLVGVLFAWGLAGNWLWVWKFWLSGTHLSGITDRTIG